MTSGSTNSDQGLRLAHCSTATFLGVGRGGVIWEGLLLPDVLFCPQITLQRSLDRTHLPQPPTAKTIWRHTTSSGTLPCMTHTLHPTLLLLIWPFIRIGFICDVDFTLRGNYFSPGTKDRGFYAISFTRHPTLESGDPRNSHALLRYRHCFHQEMKKQLCFPFHICVPEGKYT